MTLLGDILFYATTAASLAVLLWLMIRTTEPDEPPGP